MSRSASGPVAYVAARVVHEAPEPTTIPRLWKRRALAERLGVSGEWIDTWRSRGLLRAIVLHAEEGDRGVILFDERDVLEFLRARGIEP